MTKVKTTDKHKRGGKLVSGEKLGCKPSVEIDISDDVKLGNNVLISEGVIILTHDHLRRNHRMIRTSSLEIGDNVFIGCRTIITQGCKKIGKNAYIGAGCVITKDVPENAFIKRCDV